MKTIFYFLASVKSFDQIMGFHERIHELHNCAKANDDIIVPDECIAQKGLRRHRRSFDHVFYKSKAPDLCGLPCQKSRLYTTPEVRINRKKRTSLEKNSNITDLNLNFRKSESFLTDGFPTNLMVTILTVTSLSILAPVLARAAIPKQKSK